MSSQLPEFEYDIFISYRHNDNRSGWVTEFVKSLQQELAATIKQPLSVYFDSNAQDGLLENHDVDRTLEGKLKCVIFIPILSQTYTDTASFAWKHEFVAFNDAAKTQAIGRDIRLVNGNVASRILPIRIHDLDAEDKSLIEAELGGVLRSIDFIYKSSGVNRPLRSHEDRPDDNQNKTSYYDQINKVANAVKEILAGIKNNGSNGRPQPAAPDKQEATGKKLKYTAISAVIAVLIIAGIFAYQKFAEPSGTPANADRSIAVLPFVNMSNDADQEYFSDGLSEELLNLLSHVQDLKVIGRTSSFSFKGKNEDLRTIADKLNVSHILEGSVRKSANKIRVTAQLINAADGTHMWSETYDRDIKDIFQVQDEIAAAVVKQLKTILKSEYVHAKVQNAEAYNLYLEGKYFSALRSKEGFTTAKEKFHQALAIDSTMAEAWVGLGTVWFGSVVNGDIDAKTGFSAAWIAADRALGIDPDFAEAYALQSALYSDDKLDWAKADQSIKKALELSPNNSVILSRAGIWAKTFGHFDKAILLLNRSIENDPLRTGTYMNLANVYFETGRLSQCDSVLLKVMQLNPSAVVLHYQLAKVRIGQKRYNEALVEAKKETSEIWRLAILPIVYFHLGQMKESDATLKELIDLYAGDSAFQIAEAYAERKQTDLAFEWLARAKKQNDPGIVDSKVDTHLRSLHNDPRWKPYLHGLGLD